MFSRFPRQLKRHAAFPAMIALSIILVTLAQVLNNQVLAQSTEAVVWDRYDVTLDVRSDGTMHVTEYQEVFLFGNYSSGFAYIPLSNVEDLENVTVSMANDVGETPVLLDYEHPSRYDEQPGTYTYQEQTGEIDIEYAFEPTNISSPSTKVVALEYDVIGGIRVYDDLDPAFQQVW